MVSSLARAVPVRAFVYHVDHHAVGEPFTWIHFVSIHVAVSIDLLAPTVLFQFAVDMIRAKTALGILKQLGPALIFVAKWFAGRLRLIETMGRARTWVYQGPTARPVFRPRYNSGSKRPLRCE